MNDTALSTCVALLQMFQKYECTSYYVLEEVINRFTFPHVNVYIITPFLMHIGVFSLGNK